MYKRSDLLIWGTTYPEFSKTYYETVCTGAVEKTTGKLVRIYPVTLRHLDERFHKYDWISAEIEKNPKDSRPESHRIRQDSILKGEHIETSKKEGWSQRSGWVLRAGNVFRSVEHLREEQAANGTSLGLVKPKKIKRFFAVTRSLDEKLEWERKRDEAAVQKSLFVEDDSRVRDLKFPAAQYRVEFSCDDERCTTVHDLSILDWEVQMLDIRMSTGVDDFRVAEKKVLQHLERITDPAKKNAYFFLGNTLPYPQNFMVVGLYYPPREYQQRLL